MSFFFRDPPKATGRKKTPLEKIKISAETLAKQGCRACPLNRLAFSLQHPKMEPTGENNPDVYILGEAPGADEDTVGRQFVGKSGKYLRPLLPSELTYRWNNSIRCHPPENRNPTEIELGCCFPKQIADIVEHKPRVVLALGGVALQALGYSGGITAWRGRAVALHLSGHSCWLIPSFHPSYLLRTRKFKDERSEYERCFERDLDLMQYMVEKPPPKRTLFDTAQEDVTLLTDQKAIIRFLDGIKAGEFTATDIETRRYRPYAKDASWLSAAVATKAQVCAFPVAHPQGKLDGKAQTDVRAAYLRYLQRAKVYVHNASFEGEWFAHEFGYENAYSFQLEDTMAQAFVLDERPGMLSLNDLCMVHFGVDIKAIDFVDKMRLDLEPITNVLNYNGRDARFTYHLARWQNRLIEEERLTHVYLMQRSRAMCTTLAQMRGATPNKKALTKFNTDLSAQVTKLEGEISVDKYVIKWETNTGKKFNPSSNQHVLDVLKKSGLVDRNQTSVDEEALKTVTRPIAKLILDLRGVNKIKGTYIEPLLPGGKHVHDDGLIHTRYNHLLTSTGRLSSQDPNLQNFPKREGGSQYRQVIKARVGHKIVSIDYGQIEYRVIAMATLDKAVINSIFNGVDVHAHWAEKLLSRYPKIRKQSHATDDKALFKEFRNAVKNKWTFPAFYGSGVTSISASFGITERELTPLFEEFWDMFAGVRRWQRRLKDTADELGYVACLTGRRRHLPMSYNAIINSPIQGTASDIVVDGMERLSRIAVEKGDWNLHPMLNVHDDLTFDLPDDTTLEPNVEAICSEMLACQFPFINVPLTVEVSFGDTWGTLEEVATFSTDDFGIIPPAVRGRNGKVHATRDR